MNLLSNFQQIFSVNQSNANQLQYKVNTYRLHDGCLEHIHPARLQSKTQSLTILIVIQAALEHPVHDSF